MIQFDLSDAQLIINGDARHPTESELFAITVGLMVVENRSYQQLYGDSLLLGMRNHRRVAEVLEERLPPLARSFGEPLQLRRRLSELIGLRIIGIR